jgi:hypothetical protein
MNGGAKATRRRSTAPPTSPRVGPDGRGVLTVKIERTDAYDLPGTAA